MFIQKILFLSYSKKEKTFLASEYKEKNLFSADFQPMFGHQVGVWHHVGATIVDVWHCMGV